VQRSVASCGRWLPPKTDSRADHELNDRVFQERRALSQGNGSEWAGMVSYAQNAEDVVLRRVFADVERGFYVDVGASHPVADSVTLHFYESGWSGVNIEPDPSDFAALSQARPRDVNINAAVGTGPGPVTFYPSYTRGHGTLVAPGAGQSVETRPIVVPQVSLDRVFADHAPAAGVDFLKIDVEGWETEVVGATDWHAVRPRVVLVEAVDKAGTPTHEAWEPALLTASYRFGLFDGLNRFYCREEDADRLLPRLVAPANVLDNWRRASEVAARNTVADMRASISWRVTAPLRKASSLAKRLRLRSHAA
jgi:FkbM family methyltransferase